MFNSINLLRKGKEVMYYDFHTHAYSQTSKVRSIVCSVDLKDLALKADEPRGSDLLYGGIHPWYLPDKEYNDSFLDTLKLYNLNGIGEIGLDKSRKQFKKQKEYFVKQCEFAHKNQLGLNIHCVRSYGSVLDVLMEYPTVPAIIHSFNGSYDFFRQLKGSGLKNIFLSFGLKQMDTYGIICKEYSQCVLESDLMDHGTVDYEEYIHSVYKKAATLRGVEVKQLQSEFAAYFSALTGRFNLNPLY